MKMRAWAMGWLLLGSSAGMAGAAEWFVATNGSDAANGASWLTAKQTIQAGIDSATEDDLVWVSNGVYATGGGRAVVGTRANRVSIDRSITVRSVNGPAETLIVGGEMRCAYVTNGAVLSGFTLTNGTTAGGMCGLSETDTIDHRGGGAYCETNATLTNCVLTGNWACWSGGGANGGILYNCTLTNNGAGLWGAGACESILHDCALLANHCENNGGAILHCEAFGCTLIGNRASAGGGSDRSTLEHCLLADNYGGSIAGGALSSTLSWCRVTGNLSRMGGGGANLCTLYNCLLDGNRAESTLGDEPSGGGAKDSALVNCTVVSNTSFWGGGVRGGTMINCVVYGNTATNDPNWKDGSFTNCCTTPLPSGTSNVTNDPRFVDSAAGDYRLAAGSPCIEAGENAFAIGLRDLDGNPRIVNAMVDMGAYEYQDGTHLVIAPTATNLDSGASSGHEIEVLASVSWTAATNVSWLSVTPGGSGTTNGMVHFSAATNGITGARTGAVIVAGGGLSRTCTVVQAPFVPALELEPASTNVGSGAAGGLTVAVTANISWTASTNVPWLAISSSDSGTTNGTVVFDVATNAGAARTGAVIVAGGGLSRTCTVVQAAFVPALEIFPASTNAGSGGAGGLAIGVTANVAWTAATNAPWLAISSGDSGTTNGTVLFDVAANAGAARTGAVIVAGGGLARTCTVVQAAFVPALAVSPASVNAGSGGASGLALGVTANISWTAATNVPWLAISSGASGTTNGTVLFDVAANAGAARTGAVIVAGGGLSRTCTVVQAAFVPVLAVSPASVNAGSGGASGLALSVTANISWTAATNAPWLAITSGESGTTNGTVVFAVAANAGVARTGAVIVAGGGISRTCTVVQAAFVPSLAVSPARTNVTCAAAGGLALEVTANISWTAATNVPWLAITTGETGTNNGSISFDLAENATFFVRTGAIVVAGGGLSRTCAVVQAGIPFVLEVDPASTNAPAEGAAGLELAVAANIPWTATTNAVWLTITSGGSGATNGSVTFAVASNLVAAWRTGTVVVAGGNLSRTCRVVQAPGVFVPTSWYVATNGNDTADGASWATAKQTIQAGIDAAAEGDTVWVSNGVYATGGGAWGAGGSNRIVINKPITLTGVNGAEETSIRGNGMRCAYLSHTGIVVTGFTLTNGTAEWGGGAYIEAGTLENCIVRNNTATGSTTCDDVGKHCFHQAYGGGVYGGILRHCKIHENTAHASGGTTESAVAQGGGTYQSRLSTCMVWSNAVIADGCWSASASAQGGGAQGGTNENCTIVRNSAYAGSVPPDWANASGGGCHDGALVNTIVYYNTTQNSTSGVVSGNAVVESSLHSCAPEIGTSDGNVNSDPEFVNGYGSDYRLRTTSPCLNAGTNQDWMAGATDLDGNPRIGDSIVDMGAYEGGIEVFPRAWYVATNGSDAAAGTNWVTAKQTIQAGVDAASSNDVVWVSNGVYATGGGRAVVGTRTNRVSIDRAVTVRSVNGPAETLIVGGEMRCAYVTNGAVLSGFTLTNGTTASISSCSYTDIPNNRGGGAYCETNAVLTNCVLTGNWACYAGGGANGGTLNDCELIANGCWMLGGGASASVLNRCRLQENHSDQNGGGTWNCQITDCELIDNQASAGGGAYASTLNGCLLENNYGGSMGGGALQCMLSRCHMTGNLSRLEGGGAIACTLYNCLLDGNRAETIGEGDEPSGGGAKDSTLINCTVVSNTGFWGGGVRGGTMINCIVYGNTATNNPNWQDGSFTNCCTTPLPAGSGNVTSDPQFVDAAAGNYRLAAGSPCINAGDNAAAAGATDLDGSPRIVFGTVDLGAYEFLYQHVAPGGSDGADGISWATAKQTIQAAVDVTTNGCIVLVTNGVYATGGRTVGSWELTNRVAIDRPIIVQSVNGPEVTTIQGAGPMGDAAVRCAYVGSNAVLSGFTLTNGATKVYSLGIDLDACGAGLWCEPSAIIQRCLIVNNQASLGAGGCLYGKLHDCLFVGNTAGSWGGGAYESVLYNCTLTGNGAYDGGGVFRATALNSIIWGNTATNGENYFQGSISNSCTTPDPGGMGNVASDPQFVDAAAGDYRLQATSPCLDAGEDGAVSWAEDLDGNQRIVYGAVDMGAYELQLTGEGTWFGAIVNGLTGDLDCVAGDGVPNLLKYATGGSPRISDDNMLVDWTWNGRRPALTFNRNPNATDVRFVVECAEAISNGAAWRGVATNVGGSWLGATNVSESGTGNPVECTVTDPVALGTNRFLRLRVSRP